ncbi:MAG: anti-phage protein KwaB, partial [Chryseobacterium sp.]
NNSLNVIFLLNNGELKRADIIESTKESLVSQYQSSFNYLCTNDELSFLNLSSPDDRNNVLYLYDLPERPDLFSHLETLSSIQNIEGLEYFNFTQDSLADIEGYFVLFGTATNNVLFFRKQMSVNLFKRGKTYLKRLHDSQFTDVQDEFLRIDGKIDLFCVDSNVIIWNVKILERHYEFRYIMQNEATQTLEQISGLEILENLDVLQERVSDVSFVRKLSKIASNSPVFTLPATSIIQFVRSHSVLSEYFRFNSGEDKIMLDTKKSQDWFLKLMNDDFLHSQLTDFHYQTPAKDKLS